jgi:hypothetical protein
MLSDNMLYDNIMILAENMLPVQNMFSESMLYDTMLLADNMMLY